MNIKRLLRLIESPNMISTLDDVDEIAVLVDKLAQFRDESKRGSKKRSDYSTVIQRLSTQIKQLQRRLEKMKDSDETLMEGGVGGHIMHLYENQELTFAELKKLLQSVSLGELEDVSEKIDGQNLFITWDNENNILKAARNTGNIKTGGLDAAGLAAKFAGRGTVYDAFVNAFQIIEVAIKSLADDVRLQIFGPKSNIWYSVEILFVNNPNVINYDKNNVVFHKAGSGEFDKSTGKKIATNIDKNFELLNSQVENMQTAVSNKQWQIVGPAMTRLRLSSAEDVYEIAAAAITQLQSRWDLTDSDTIGDYIESVIEQKLKQFNIDKSIIKLIFNKLTGKKGGETVPQIISKITDETGARAAKEIIQRKQEIYKKIIAPLEDIIQTFAINVLRGVNSSFILDNSKEVKRLRQETQAAISAIESAGDENAMRILQSQLMKLRSIENISTAMEGIVFVYKGQSYKLTGSFSAVNQILGLFKYGRGKKK